MSGNEELDYEGLMDANDAAMIENLSETAIDQMLEDCDNNEVSEQAENEIRGQPCENEQLGSTTSQKRKCDTRALTEDISASKRERTSKRTRGSKQGSVKRDNAKIGKDNEDAFCDIKVITSSVPNHPLFVCCGSPVLVGKVLLPRKGPCEFEKMSLQQLCPTAPNCASTIFPMNVGVLGNALRLLEQLQDGRIDEKTFKRQADGPTKPHLNTKYLTSAYVLAAENCVHVRQCMDEILPEKIMFDDVLGWGISQTDMASALINAKTQWTELTVEQPTSFTYWSRNFAKLMPRGLSLVNEADRGVVYSGWSHLKDLLESNVKEGPSVHFVELGGMAHWGEFSVEKILPLKVSHDCKIIFFPSPSGVGSLSAATRALSNWTDIVELARGRNIIVEKRHLDAAPSFDPSTVLGARIGSAKILKLEPVDVGIYVKCVMETVSNKLAGCFKEVSLSASRPNYKVDSQNRKLF